MLALFLSIACTLGLSVTAQIIKPCHVKDEACINEVAKELVPKLMPGIPSLGLQSLDPLFVESVDSNLSILKFKLSNSTYRGFKSCKVSNVKLNLDASTLKFVADCGAISISGDYTIKGRLIILPVEGTGTYTIDSKRTIVNFDGEVKKLKGKDGREHLQIKNFKLKVDPRESMHYDFKNLFNGQKDLADALLKFANKNWKEVAEFTQGPVWNENFKKFIFVANKLLKTVPLEDILMQ